MAVVQYPGREDRFSEPFIDAIPLLLEALQQELQPRLKGRRFVLFGHSMNWRSVCNNWAHRRNN